LGQERAIPNRCGEHRIARWKVRQASRRRAEVMRYRSTGRIGRRGAWGILEKGVKMMKGCLTAAAVIAILTVSTQAGEIKLHEWPCQFISVEITSIPVMMDVGYWVKIKDQDRLRIKLVQDEEDIHKFKGCTDMTVENNFNVVFSCSISATGAVPGEYSCNVNPTDLPAGGGTVQVCATLKKADLSKTPGNSKDVQVATVKIKVRPQ
jgi:hypothetical protein